MHSGSIAPSAAGASFPDALQVDSLDVMLNILTVNLLIFHIVDFEDKTRKLHNGHQILLLVTFNTQQMIK